MKFEINTYDPELVKPMREEVTALGFTELLTPEDAEIALKKDGSALIYINSVCGCAAAKARPGLKIAIKYAKEYNFLPDFLYTAFAGMEKTTVEYIRKFFTGYNPSSPQIALLRDGKLTAMLERKDIENNNELIVAEKIIDILKENYRKD